MAKCVRCGRGGMGILHQAVKLNDGNLICFKCYKELGGSPLKDMTKAMDLYAYDDIKDGFDAMYSRRAAKATEAVPMIKFAHYGEERDFDDVPEEAEIFDRIVQIIKDAGGNTENIRMTAKSDQYRSIVMGQTDIARIKWSPRAKWITLPYAKDELGSSKRRIESPAEIEQWSEEILRHYDQAKRFWDEGFK